MKPRKISFVKLDKSAYAHFHSIFPKLFIIQSQIQAPLLTAVLKKAAEQTDIKEIAIAGGVAANSGLRNKLHEIAAQKNWKVF
ncbi:MAG: hypothetical protein B7Z83_09990, partial [Thiomonas sp. 20-64-5]